MELLYIWINKSRNGFVTKTGFNFYGEHQFTLQIQENPKRYTFSYSSLSLGFSYGASCIKNITALVGENGAGKTTLFECIYSGGCLPRPYNDNPEYERMYEDDYETHKRILVYRFGDNIKIIHNLESGTFDNQTTFTVHNINDATQDERVYLFELMEQQTIIFLSNSNYLSAFNGYETHGKVNNVSLTPNSLKTTSKKFYKKIIRYPDGPYENNYFIILQGLLIKPRTTQDFQQICDVLYYHRLCSSKSEELYSLTACKDLYVSFVGASRLIETIDGYAYISKSGFASNDPNIARLSKQIRSFISWTTDIPVNIRREAFSTLYLNMIFEMYYCWDCTSLEKYRITSLEDFCMVITSMISCYKEQPKYKEDQADYYSRGLEEACKLHAIIRNCETIDNNVPESDLAHRFDKVVSYKGDPDTYLRFCAFIDLIARSRQSVLLKYIRIDNLYMSSGERAFQNFFSWLNLPPKFDEYIEGNPIPIRDNLLFLIDEIDLYMHPEWQRQAIKTLIDELSHQYGEKEIQVIVSTHSPLVLSDIPKQNTIYLKPQYGKLHISNSDGRPQTFGANIHTLLNNAFFLSSTMGAYAYTTIKKIGDDLMQLQRNPTNEALKKTCRDYMPLIELIGEPLIRNKLIKIFNEHFPEFYEEQLETYRNQMLTFTSLSEESINKQKARELKDTLNHALTMIDAILGDIK